MCWRCTLSDFSSTTLRREAVDGKFARRRASRLCWCLYCHCAGLSYVDRLLQLVTPCLYSDYGLGVFVERAFLSDTMYVTNSTSRRAFGGFNLNLEVQVVAYRLYPPYVHGNEIAHRSDADHPGDSFDACCMQRGRPHDCVVHVPRTLRCPARVSSVYIAVPLRVVVLVRGERARSYVSFVRRELGGFRYGAVRGPHRRGDHPRDAAPQGR